MADSPADSTEAKADTLRLELHKVLTDVFHDGLGKNGGENEGSNRVLKAIDESVVRILDCLRKVESEKPPLKVPEEFICTLSKNIMIQPMIISSGQTYEHRYITEWLKHNRTCPKTKEVLSHMFLTPNHLMNELITQWCRVNKVDRPKRSSDELFMKLFSDDMESLLQRISSPSSVSNQLEAAKELSRQTKKYVTACIFFVAQLPNSITRLLTPLSVLGDDVDANPELQESIITSLLNISTAQPDTTVIAKNPHVMPLLAKSLQKGTVVTQEASAATLTLLSDIASNRIIIGNSEALKALIDLLERSSPDTTVEAAAHAVLDFCNGSESYEKAISAGLIPVVIKNIKAGRYVDEMLNILTSICTDSRAAKEMEDLGFFNDLLGMLRKPSSSMTCENAVEIIFNMFMKNKDGSRLEMLEEEEIKHGTFMELSHKGSHNAVGRAEWILRWIKRFADSKERATEGTEA
ncbi:hypothetical protein CARUB_v10000898mg [Capsella rubella]|uniref:RING-type E3 ubiquitin transferase n=1 Tax=Capsella rubella TaxID=81985 RepID=R0HAG0_9BRAS|nr:putative U-box domain-containing protein 46 [Capsella rubella]EOA20588.1 hypothetical protein CARUB_v10000898mg [Capsella rubella]